MFLSYLMIDTSAAGPAPGRKWIGNPYRVHQRLCMAFPSDERRTRDSEFLDRFIPAEFLESSVGHVRVPRTEQAGFLFRVDPRTASSPSRHIITVQSGWKPDWEYAFNNVPEFLAAKPVVNPHELTYSVGQKLHFRLRTSPTQRLHKYSKHPDGSLVANWHNEKKTLGRRVGLTRPDQQRTWLESKAVANGFRILEVASENHGILRMTKTGDPRKDDSEPLISALAVRFDGDLEVSDRELFRKAVIAGIGSNRGFGFGLLSVVPV